jgi:regulator of RNase E activity RraA
MVCLTLALLLAQAQPELSRTSRDTYHPLTDIMKSSTVRATDQQLEKLKTLPLEAIWGAVRAQGYTNCCYAGLKSSRPQERVVGRALTIRYLSDRPDLREAHQKFIQEAGVPAGWHVRAGEEAKPGDVLVADLGGLVAEGVFFGDISALAAQVRGAAGAILWGASRDLIELQEMKGFPVLAVGFDPGVNVQIPVDWNGPVRVGNATVLAGDVVVADAEAVIFFPAKIADAVIARAQAVKDQEDYERNLVREKKHRFRDVYPLNKELREQYEKQRKKQ